MNRESFCLIWLNPCWHNRSQSLIMELQWKCLPFPWFNTSRDCLTMRRGNRRRDIFSPYIPGFTSVEVILRPPQDCLDARQELQIKNHKHFGALNPKTFSSIKLKASGNGRVVLTGIGTAQGTTRGPPTSKQCGVRWCIVWSTSQKAFHSP